ncbi:acyltransferase [Variovorax sp. J22G21]|uniref:acyltransferase family protein n=1 Tax=Variovorax fucosicus TaxID=3053517 RepID=UPI0025775ED6|nr:MULTISPECIES: acyltransferase [unclassified Variovorax]MDM0038035.1 acyltransferase [Variovorax sp. J22R193]MDM0062811.1 acyltransferase [Variovorax sp. J22G21]
MDKDKHADGLRGIAAFTVFISHFLLAFFPAGLVLLFPGVAGEGALVGKVEQVINTPFLSLLWNGRFSVSVFFVLSGYVLTKAFVERGDPEILRAMAAQRYLRLGIPVFFSVALAFVLMTTVGYKIDGTLALTSSAWLLSQKLPSGPDVWAALREGLYGSMVTDQHYYNPALWTMRMEFIGSMLIFAYRLIAWPGRRSILAATIYVALIFFLVPQFWPFYLAFLLGSHIGEWPRPQRKVVAWFTAIAGLALASVDASPMFSWMNALPLELETRFQLYCVLGGALVVYGVRGGAFSLLLGSPFAQFLGRISFPFYLVHLPILFTVGCGTFNWLLQERLASRSAAASAAFVATSAVIIVVAWAFEKVIDTPAIRFAKFLFPTRRVAGATPSAGTRPVLA